MPLLPSECQRVREGRVLFGIVAALAALLVPVAARSAEADSTAARLRSAVAHVGIARSSGERIAIRWLGSGFLADRRCTILTAAHILEGIEEEQLIVRLIDAERGDRSQTFSARVLHLVQDSDLALLRFGTGELAARSCRSRRLMSLDPAPPIDGAALFGEDVLIAGFPVIEGEQPRDPPVVKRGIVASAELEWEGRPMLLLDLTGIPGFSGSPVVRARDGKVIGVVYGPGRTERQYDLEWATPISSELFDRYLEAASSATDPSD